MLNSSQSSRDYTQRFLARLGAGASEAEAWREMTPVEGPVRKTYAEWKPRATYNTWKVPLPGQARFTHSARAMSPVEVASRLVELAMVGSSTTALSPRHREALAHLRRVDRSGEAADLWRALSAFYTRSTELGDAAALFRAYLERRPDDPQGNLGLFLSLLDKMASTTTEAEQREIMNSLKASVPKVVQLARAPFALNAIARYWVLIDQPKAAVPFLRRALHRDPACAPCYATLALARYQEQRFAEAVQAQEHAIAALGDRRPTAQMTQALEVYRAAAATPASAGR